MLVVGNELPEPLQLPGSGVEHDHRGGIQILANPYTAKEIWRGIADGDVKQAFLCVQRRGYPNPAATAGRLIRAASGVESGLTFTGDCIKSPYGLAVR